MDYWPLQVQRSSHGELKSKYYTTKMKTYGHKRDEEKRKTMDGCDKDAQRCYVTFSEHQSLSHTHMHSHKKNKMK